MKHIMNQVKVSVLPVVVRGVAVERDVHRDHGGHVERGRRERRRRRLVHHSLLLLLLRDRRGRGQRRGRGHAGHGDGRRGGVALDLHDGRGVLDDVHGLLLRGLEGYWEFGRGLCWRLGRRSLPGVHCQVEMRA